MLMLRRGQTLLLFVLTLLLLTVMVCMTLSFSTKAKEKMELQTLADTAAYSNAVMTARTYNAVSVLNRAQIAHMVAMAGVQSLISWSGYYRSNLFVGMVDFGVMLPSWIAGIFNCCRPFSPCPQFCGCSISGTFQLIQNIMDLWQEDQRVGQEWMSKDQAAGDQVRALQGAATTLYVAGQLPAFGNLMLEVNNQNMAKKVIQGGRNVYQPGEIDAPNQGENITMRETGWNPFGPSAVLVLAPIRRHAVHAGMGSRGHPFVTGRLWGMADMFINNKLRDIITAPDTLIAAGGSGSGYFDTALTHAAASANGGEAWADDHNMLTTGNFQQSQPCPWMRTMAIPVFPGSTFARSTHSGDGQDMHRWFGGSDPNPIQRHTLGPSLIPPRGIWPRFMDYNFVTVASPGDIYGQPKNFAVIQRDYAARPGTFSSGQPGGADPWNLFFRFRFTPAGEEFDGRGIQLRDQTDISRQVALSTGVTYFHRKGHWSEPPNFFNPFWRAGLVHPDVDDQGKGGDIPQALNDINYPAATDAYQGLRAGGFKGWQ
ncbi:MAG: hypothetical protein HYZ28_20365 [Myxococcales bacterium]|nr:hypothetical protein [Myxococcales bacterium]